MGNRKIEMGVPSLDRVCHSSSPRQYLATGSLVPHQFHFWITFSVEFWNYFSLSSPSATGSPLSIKYLPASVGEAGSWVWSLGREDLLEEEMAMHSSILASKKISKTEVPGRLQSMGHRVWCNWAHMHGTSLKKYHLPSASSITSLIWL